MKRLLEEDSKLKFTIATSTEDRIDCAVSAACYGELTVLSRQPIILYCAGEEGYLDFNIAYWPREKEIGKRVLATLDHLFTEDAHKHVFLVDALFEVARGKATESHLKRVCKRFLVKDIVEVGHFMMLKEASHLIPTKDYGGDMDPLCIIEETSLSAHLYRHTCTAWY